MKLIDLRNLFFVVLSILCSTVQAYNLEGSTFIECELRLKAKRSRAVKPNNLKLVKSKLAKSTSFTRPNIMAKKSFKSYNWSGYIAAPNLETLKRHTVIGVYGSWTVPTLAESSQNTWCSVWVGMDGYDNNTVEQIGTEHDWCDGQQKDYAFFEMYPNYSFEFVGFPVRPGDFIQASVEYENGNGYALLIANATAKVHTVVPADYTMITNARRTCAAWVVEAPFAKDILPLSNFNTVSFTECAATINYMHGPITNKSWKFEKLTMLSSDGEVKALTSNLSENGGSFDVTWKHE